METEDLKETPPRPKAWIVENTKDTPTILLIVTEEELSKLPSVDSSRPATLDEVMNALSSNKEEQAIQAKIVKEMKENKDALEKVLIDLLDDAGITRACNDVINVSVSEEIVPAVQDWEAVFNYIKENDAFYLLQKRLTAAPYRELINLGDELPGVTPFTKRNLSARTI